MDKSKRRRRRENEELRLLVFVLSYSNYELGLYGIRLVDRLIESFPMLIRHVARRKQRHAGRSVLHGASYGLLDLGRDQSMAFRVLDIRLGETIRRLYVRLRDAYGKRRHHVRRAVAFGN